MIDFGSHCAILSWAHSITQRRRTESLAENLIQFPLHRAPVFPDQPKADPYRPLGNMPIEQGIAAVPAQVIPQALAQIPGGPDIDNRMRYDALFCLIGSFVYIITQ